MVMNEDMLKKLRPEIEAWIDSHLADLTDEPLELPIVSDYSLVLAMEDGADPDAATHYVTISSYVPAYRLYGLLTAVRERFRGPIVSDDDD